MREPRFWWRPPRTRAAVLSPAAAVYGAVAARRIVRAGKAAGVPVICVGNFTLGGAGKTPAALAVAMLLAEAGRRPVFLSRGYGGRLKGPVAVDPAQHRAADVGDEPLLLARLAPAIVSCDRIAGAEAARAAGAGVIVMDDGFQNPSLRKDLSLLVVDGRRGLGNGRVVPAGPLRAPLDVQLARADALLVMGNPAGALALIDEMKVRGRPVFHGRLDPDTSALAVLRERPVLAFAGIGHPERFFTTLEQAGVDVLERRAFPDHHRYRAIEASDLLARAATGGLTLATTEKDWVRLSGEDDLAALAGVARPLPVRLVVAEQTAFAAWVAALPGL